jgi:hypothetical protein
MSRAMNLSMPQREVADLCETLGVATTSIESLIPQGTRVVCKTAEGSAILLKKVKTSLIQGSITRTPRSIRASW